jgi:hypothetical protein
MSNKLQEVLDEFVILIQKSDEEFTNEFPALLEKYRKIIDVKSFNGFTPYQAHSILFFFLQTTAGNKVSLDFIKNDLRLKLNNANNE